MPLTVDELRTKHAALLEHLVADLMAAVRSGDPDEMDVALDSLVDYRAMTPFPGLQLEAAKARDAASSSLAEVALEELSRISDEATRAGAGFRAAATIAESGKKELLFPALAASTARSLQLMTQFQAAIESVGENVADISELGEVPAALNGVLEAVTELQETIEEVE